MFTHLESLRHLFHGLIFMIVIMKLHMVDRQLAILESSILRQKKSR